MLKRIFDIAASACALIILSPVLLVVMLLVRTKLGAPIFFTQVRPGLHGKPFKMVKFRTMTDERDEKGELLPDAVRLTKFGRLLRKTSLDELPELWNILKGDMSVVGPRPLLMRYLPYYTEEENVRHNVKPGLTGLAQVTGRNAITWEDKLALDVEYVKKQSLALDLKIILLTVLQLFKSSEVLEAAPQGPLDKYRESQHEK